MLGDEPPYLSVGTEVSAKYKGAFCEAKVRKVDKTVKCKVTFKLGNGTHTVLDSLVKGTLRVGASVEVKHPEKKEFVEATITKIQDCSQYTVVFDDGDITTLRRSALCLKSGRHFAESETLDQLPLTHPEHFGNPVVGGRRGRRRLLDDSSDEEETTRKGKRKEEKEADVGKVICVELGDKKKMKDNWFPGLVVSPNAQDTVQIRVKDEYLVRSFSDGRYYTVPKKEATEFTREIGSKVDNNTLKTAVEKALYFLDKDELPPHWDRELLFGLIESDINSDSDDGLDSDSSDDEPREEKDHFVAQLYKFMDDRGTPINNCPTIASKDLDLYKLFNIVHKLNGYNRVTNRNQWKIVSNKLGLGAATNIVSQVKHAYKKYLHSFEDFYRKLGCTMVSHPRSNRARNKSGRSLIRDKDKAASKLKNELSPGDSSKEPGKADDGSDKEGSADAKVKEEPASEKKDEKVKVKEEGTEKPAKGRPPKKEAEAEDVSESEDSVSVSEDSVPRPISGLRKKFPTLKASPVVVREKRKIEVSPENRKSKRSRMVKSKSSSDVKGGSDGEDDSKSKDSASDTRSTTRSRSKEDVKAKKEPEKEKKNKTTTADNNKKVSGTKPKRHENEDPHSQKKGRKRRNTETGGRSPSAADEDLNLPCLPNYKSVFVGDVLKIYYGAPGEPKQLYEAKVVDIKENDAGETLYLVHYAGWNSRYDEWVKRNKIADNLNWSSARSKVSPSVKQANKPAQKRRPLSSKTDQSCSGARSTTPSSITSTSSRTKSPATSAQGNRRVMRSSGELRTAKRTRRVSGHTDISVDSESDSDIGNSVSDTETKKKTPTPAKEADSKKEEKKPPVKRRMTKKAEKKAAEEDEEEKEEKEEKVKGRRSKKAAANKEKDVEDKKDEKVEENDEKPETQEPKGRDFDLNQIRSELKGIDKAVKINNELLRLDSIEDKGKLIVEDKVVIEEPVEPKVVLTKIEDEKSPLKAEEKADVKEDIYEFKEPEPFEYQEVLRPMNRMFDDGERSPEKISTKKPSGSAEKKEPSGFEVDVKSRFRKTMGKKTKEVSATEKKEPVIEKLDSSPKKLDGFKDGFTLASFKVKSPEKEIPVLQAETEVRKSMSPEPLITVFSSVQEEVAERKLESIITRDRDEPIRREIEDTRQECPLPHKMSPEPPNLTPITSNIFNDDRPLTSPLLIRITEEPKSTTKMTPDEEDDPINAAIQRVIAQSSMDDDSDDMNFFPSSSSTTKDLTTEVTKTSEGSYSEKKNEGLLSKKVCTKRKSVNKRMILSKEFVMDDSSTDSDSDSAEERLVIVNEEDSTDDSSQGQKLSAINMIDEKKPTGSLVDNKMKRADDGKSFFSANELPVSKKASVREASPSKKCMASMKADDEWKLQKQEKTTEEEGENNLRSLLCEETIPGSPAPVVEVKEVAEAKLNLIEMQFASGSQPVPAPPPPPATAKRDGNDAAVVMDNTPPTTPESNLSSISGSPREDRVGSSSLDNESSKSHRDSSEVDVDNDHQRMRNVKFPKKPVDKDPESPSKKKRRNRKRSESLSEMTKRVRQPVGRPPKVKDAGSDSDDTSENSQIGTHSVNTDPLLNSRSQRPSKYNFYCELDPELDASQRIALLEQKLQECRKMYMNVKTKLSTIERRRKKLRRREREEKASAAAAAKNQDLMCA